MSDRFAEIVDRQVATERKGEAERQACDNRRGYGHKEAVRKRAAKRMAR